ncbi:MAG: alpha/beta hydrolase, partial [Nonomuraea sp.]|nr:alpha/beta hydrolase [Nonomuraea sp.]
KANRSAPFMTWPNAWYNAPCAFWSVKGGTPVPIKSSPELPPILMLQSRGDAATPYPGALAMKARFPGARMVVDGGGNHGVSLVGDKCVDGYLTAYLNDGTLPADGTACKAMPAPKPSQKMMGGGPAGHERLTELIT